MEVCISRLIWLQNPGCLPLAMQARGDVRAELLLQAGLNAHAQNALRVGIQRH